MPKQVKHIYFQQSWNKGNIKWVFSLVTGNQKQALVQMITQISESKINIHKYSSRTKLSFC